MYGQPKLTLPAFEIHAHHRLVDLSGSSQPACGPPDGVIHPDLSVLIRCRDGILPPEREAAIRIHLAGCRSCLADYRRLCRPPAEPTHPPDPRLLARIRSSIRNWEAQRSAAGWGEAVKFRTAREIGPFLGNNGARILLRPVSDDGCNLLSTIEPVLGEFLGKRAASELVSRVVEAAIMRTW